MDSSIALTLTTPMMIVLVLIAFAMLMFTLEWVRADVVALLVLVILGITGLVPVRQIFQGFSGDAVMAILATMILGAGLDRTGVMSLAAAYILKISKGAEHRLLLFLCSMAGGLSAFIQNPAVATLFLPVASRLSSRTGLPLSRLLMPMAVCIMLGGTITMVGNSPQILLNDLLASVNRNLPSGADTLEPFSVFAVAPVGLTLLLAGLAFFGLWSKKLLPSRDDKTSVTPSKTETYFASTYGISGEVVEVLVTADSPLVGLSVVELESDVNTPLLLAIKTGDESRLAPPADQMIWVGTILGVLGARDEISQWAQNNELRMLARLRNFGDMFNPNRAGISEAVVPPNSRFVGKALGELRLRKRFNIAVVAVNRGKKIFREDLRQLSIRQGDTLVFHSFWKDLAQASEERDFVVVTDFPKEEQRPHKIWNAVVFFGVAIALALFSDLSLPLALLTGALGMLLTGVLSMDEAYRSINWKTIFLMATLIPLGWAMDATGAAAWVAQNLLQQLGDVSNWQLQLALAILTAFFTAVMSNVGATIVMVPMAINVALAADGDPRVFALVVAISASNNFLTVSNPVLAIVAGPAGYRVADLWRVGAPMTVIHLFFTLLIVNLVI